MHASVLITMIIAIKTNSTIVFVYLFILFYFMLFLCFVCLFLVFVQLFCVPYL